MHFAGEFRVPGKADDVIRRFADVPRMARCMPGAVLEPQTEDGAWPGAMVVAFGPKKINFKGRVTCEFDFAAKTGTLQGRGTADMRAARIGVKVAFALRDDDAAAEPMTVVKVTADAELGGVLADFARTGGIAVANVIMQDFARRAAEEFSKDSPSPPAAADAGAQLAAAPPGATAGMVDAPLPAAPPSPSSAAAPPSRAQAAAPVAALSAHGILWQVIKFKLRHLAQWLGLRAKDTA